MTPPARTNLESKTLWGDVRRMAPVWAIVGAAAVAALVSIRLSGAEYLRAGVVELADKCRVAEIQLEAGRRTWRTLLEVVKESPNRARAESSMGELKGDARLAKARGQLQEAVELCPRIRGAHRLMADLAWWEGNAAETHYLLGAEHRAEGEWSMALAEFETAIAIDAKHDRAPLAAAEMASKLGQWEAVEKALASLDPASRERPAALRVRAALAERRGAPEEAISDLFAAADLEPGNVDTIRALFRLYYDRDDRLTAADRILKNVLSAQSPEAESYHQAALLYMRGEVWQKGLDAIEMAIALAPNNVDLQFDKAIMLSHLGRVAEARRVGEIALSINPALFWKRVEDARFNPVAPSGS